MLRAQGINSGAYTLRLFRRAYHMAIVADAARLGRRAGVRAAATYDAISLVEPHYYSPLSLVWRTSYLFARATANIVATLSHSSSLWIAGNALTRGAVRTFPTYKHGHLKNAAFLARLPRYALGACRHDRCLLIAGMISCFHWHCLPVACLPPPVGLLTRHAS